MLDDREEQAQTPDGPVREKNPQVVPARGIELLDGFELVTVDLNNEKQVITSCRLLNEILHMIAG